MALSPTGPKTIPQTQGPPPALPPDFSEFAPRAGYHVEPDGRVYTLNGSTKSYVPPWIVWQNSSAGKDPTTGQLTPEGMSYRVPGSDPSSVWHFMYEQSGPFRKGSQWDSSNGTYKGSVDWGTLLGTIAAGGIIGAGIAGAAGGGSALAGDVGSTTTVPELAGPSLVGTAAGPGAVTTATGLGTAPIAAESGTALASGAGLPGAVAVPAAADVAAPALASTTIAPTATTLAPGVATSGGVPAAVTGGTAAATPGILSKTLSTLTQPSVLSTIASGALSAYGASQAAGAQTDAAKIIADANTAAAKIQADAATQAAQIQAKSTAEALDFAKSGYNNQLNAYNTNQQQLAPYTGAGTAAVTKLSQLLGLGAPSVAFTPLQPVPTNATAATAQTGAQTMARPGTAAQQASADAFVPTAVKGSPSLSAVPQGPGPNAGSIASLSQQPALVTMRAPDGSTRQVPQDHVQDLLTKGAKLDTGAPTQDNVALATQAARTLAVPTGTGQGIFA